MRHKVGEEWQTVTWTEYRDTVLQAARGFVELGLKPGRGVAIIGFNRPEWFISELAAVAAGGVVGSLFESYLHVLLGGRRVSHEFMNFLNTLVGAGTAALLAQLMG